MAKIDKVTETYDSLTSKLDDHISTTKSSLSKCTEKENDIIKSINFLNKEVHDLREEIETSL